MLALAGSSYVFFPLLLSRCRSSSTSLHRLSPAAFACSGKYNNGPKIGEGKVVVGVTRCGFLREMSPDVGSRF